MALIELTDSEKQNAKEYGDKMEKRTAWWLEAVKGRFELSIAPSKI